MAKAKIHPHTVGSSVEKYLTERTNTLGNYGKTCLWVEKDGEDEEPDMAIPANRVDIRNAHIATQEVCTFEGPDNAARAEAFFVALWNENITTYLTLTNNEQQGFFNHFRFLTSRNISTIGYFTLASVQKLAQHSVDPHAPQADIEIWSAEMTYDGQARKIVHIAYDTWPDGGTIAGDNVQAAQKLQLIAEQLHQHGVAGKKIAMNCNAGVSRTCCALIAHLAYERHLAGQESDLAVLQSIVRTQTPYKEEILQTLQLQAFVTGLNEQLRNGPQPVSAAAAAVAVQPPVEEAAQPQSAYKPLSISISTLTNTDYIRQVISDNAVAWMAGVGAQQAGYNAAVSAKPNDTGGLRFVCLKPEDADRLAKACEKAGIKALRGTQEDLRRRSMKRPCVDIAHADVERFVFDVLQTHKGVAEYQEQQCRAAVAKAVTQLQPTVGF